MTTSASFPTVSDGALPAAGRVVLEGIGLSKYYGPITALDGVNLQVRSGEITAVVGDNGAGKSTLVKTFCGAVQPDDGEIRYQGKIVRLRTPRHARSLGIETVFQDLALAPNRDVTANLYLGRELLRGRHLGPLAVVDRAAEEREARGLIEHLEVDLPLVGVPVARLSGGQRQAVAVARAAFWAQSVILMDEPTAALGVRQSQAVLKLARRVADSGIAVVLISHILPHVMALADRVVVLRHGRLVADLAGQTVTSEQLIALIVGYSDSSGGDK